MQKSGFVTAVQHPGLFLCAVEELLQELVVAGERIMRLRGIQ